MPDFKLNDIVEYVDGTFDQNLEDAKSWAKAHNAVIEEQVEKRHIKEDGTLLRYFIIRSKSNEELQFEVRSIRDQLLKESDWTQTLDAPLTEEQKEAWRVYRQALRNVPAQEGFPENVTWPEVETLNESEVSNG